VDYEAVAAGLNQAIPFNRHLGLVVEEVAPGRGVVTLPDGDHLHNHVGSQHAGGLFSAGEAASGGAFLGAFAEHLGGLTPLAKSASIDYRKIARGPVTATGTLDADVDALLASIESDGRVEFPIEVEMTDSEANVVATMTVHWHVRASSPQRS
jgi:acyl-coenzyme A thioesterase PaaI-like protein